ncbi:MAG: hypothetical protein CSYNP_03648 [Syntrophus sp. SKADARSKE-3]|nr:hypothetical protein [Syntrophus sp. SKADARSKE-3]
MEGGKKSFVANNHANKQKIIKYMTPTIPIYSQRVLADHSIQTILEGRWNHYPSMSPTIFFGNSEKEPKTPIITGFRDGTVNHYQFMLWQRFVNHHQ